MLDCVEGADHSAVVASAGWFVRPRACVRLSFATSLASLTRRPCHTVSLSIFAKLNNEEDALKLLQRFDSRTAMIDSRMWNDIMRGFAER